MYFLCLVPLVVESDEAYLWYNMTTGIFRFALVWLRTANGDGFSMLKTTGSQIVADGLGDLLPVLHRLAFWTEQLGFFSIICKT